MVSINSKLEIAPSNFKEFYVYYRAKHTKDNTKRLHVAGTGVAIIGFLFFILFGGIFNALISVLMGCGICWAGDFIFEGEQPTTFKFPMWSIQANMKMVIALVKGDEKL